MCFKEIRVFRFRSLFKYILSASLLLFLMTKIDLHVLIEKSGSLNIWLLCCALMFIIFQILFLNLRWHILLNADEHDISFKTSSLMNIIGYFANIVFITSVGGIIAKSGLAVRHGLSLAQALFITFLDRFMTLAALIVLSVAGLPFLYGAIDYKFLVIFVFVLCFLIALMALSVFILRSGVLRTYILSSRKRVLFIGTLRNFAQNYDLIKHLIFYSLVAQICFVFCVYVLSLGVEKGPLSAGHTIEFLALIPVLALISSLPISFGGWGVREGAFMYGLSLIGFTMESAFFLSIQVGLVTLVAPFFVGLPYLLSTDLKEFLLVGQRERSAKSRA